MAEVIVFCVGIACANSYAPVLIGNIVEEKVFIGGLGVVAASCRQAAAVGLTAVRRHHIGAGVAVDFFIPDMHARAAISAECIAKDDVMRNGFLEENAMPDIAVGDIEKGGAIDGMGVQVNPVHPVAGYRIGDRMHP